MGLLQVAVFGSPEIFHNGNRLTFALRKAQALLLYLSLEGGVHSRGKLAAFLWPDSEPQDARNALRNVIMLLRNLLAHPDAPLPLSNHLLSQRDFIGLDPQAQLAVDHATVLHMYQRVQLFSTLPTPEQRSSLIAEVQHALSLVRGPFLDGFWLGEDAPFDEWIRQQQQQWQVRLSLLYDRLSFWQETLGEFEPARMTLTHWLTLNPLHEEAYRRLMQTHLALGAPEAALQVYATCRTRLAEELQVQPSSETIELAEHVRTQMLHHHERAVPIQSHEPPHAILSPLIGRDSAFSQLVGCYRDARQGHPQGIIIEGEAGIGKTRLVSEFLAWARALRADTLSGHVLESGVRLPYQPLIEAIRSRLEEENAPEDLLDDVWLVELSRVLPELRVRYPDLPTPSQDGLTDQLRFFEAVARLFMALAQHQPVILFVDDVQWLDSASSDLLHYLARQWHEQHTPILLIYTVRSEALAMDLQLSVRFADARRILSFREVTLQPLSQQEVLHLTEAIIAEVGDDLGRKSQPSQDAPTGSNTSKSASLPQNSRVQLAQLLFEQTDGQPLYLIETFKLLLDRQWVVPKLSTDGTAWHFVLTMEIPEAFTQKRVRHELLAPSIRTMILARLSTLSTSTRQLLMAVAVLGNQATTKHIWQVADLPSPTGLEALEEAIKSGLLREMEAWRGRMGSYRFAHELERDVIYTEIGEARRRFLHLRTLELLTNAGAYAAELAYHAHEAGEIEATYRYTIQAGDEALTVFAVKEAIVYYEQARSLLHQQIAQTMVDPFPKMDSSRVNTQNRDDQTKTYSSQFPFIEHLYTSLSHAYTFLQAEQQAMEIYEELLTHARQQQNSALVSDILNRIAMMGIHRHTVGPRVEALMQEAVLMASMSGDKRVQTITALSLAQIAFLREERNLKSALMYAEQALALARSNDDRELEAKSLHLLGFFFLWKGDFREAINVFEAALKLYAILSSDPDAPRTYSILLFLAADTPSPTHFLRDRATEALCWGHLALAQLHTGHLQQSLLNGRRPTEIFKEIRVAWAQFDSSIWLTYALLEAGSYQEALALIQQTIKLMQTDQNTSHSQIHLGNLHFALASTYQALQQWERAQAIFTETLTSAEGVLPAWLCIPPISRLCMHYALREEWEQAYHYAMKAMTLRKHLETSFVALDFFRSYEIEALLQMGEETLAREEVQLMEAQLEPGRRFRIPYLRSLAVLARRDGQNEQSIKHLRQATQLAIDLSLPTEHWQLQATLGEVYEVCGQQAQADTAFKEAIDLLQNLTHGIEDEAQRALFVNEPFVQQILQRG